MLAPRRTRRSFLAASAALLAALVTACGEVFGRRPEGELGEGRVAGSVIVIGAGPAGMTAAHLLQQRGADVRVLEAAPTHGGRIAHDLEFVDFPIPLGAEWIHVDRSVLDDIVADDAVTIETVTVGYTDDDQYGEIDEDLELTLRGVSDFPDLKFVGSSWLDFFDTYIVPGIASLITYQTVIESIDYGDQGVVLTDSNGRTHEADRVIVTVPLKMLQLGSIEFEPALPDGHLESIDDAVVWSGFKAFIEFDEAFYPAFLAPPDSETDEGQRLFYDAAHGQDSDANVLGVFSVGAQAERYQAAGEGAIDLILDELDLIYGGTARASYVQHRLQDWNAEPFARAAYLSSLADYRTSRRLAEPVADRVFFAGDAYTKFDDWGSVHAAVWSARDAVRAMLD